VSKSERGEADAYEAAYKFANEWLWSSKKRKSTGVPWGPGYIKDTAQMLADYLATRKPESAEPAISARELAEKLFEGVALRVDQFFKAKNIQGGVRSGDDLFSPMDKHELAKTIERYAQARAALAPREDKP